MIVSWFLRLVVGIVIGKVWRRLSGRRKPSAPSRVPIRPDLWNG